VNRVWGLEAKFDVGVGSVHGLVAAGAPAGALLETADVTSSRRWAECSSAGSCIRVTLEAECRIAFGEHLLVHRAMRAVAGRAAFLNRIMSEYKVGTLGTMALGAGFIPAVELGAAAFNGIALVRVMAIRAGHLAVQHLVGERHAELRLGIQVTLEAGFRGFVGIHDRARTAAGFDVFATWAVAGFAAHIDGVLALGLKFGVICGFEVTDGFFVALGAFFRSDEGGSWDTRWGHHRAAGRSAGNQDQRR